MQKKGFTLAELLVVMLLIALVMGLLMPALARARQQGRSVLCLSNLRQMTMASMMYVNVNNGYFPMVLITEVSGPLFKLKAWDFTTVHEGSKRYVEPGLLWQGEMMERIQQCPSFRGPANWANDPYTGYNYNASYLGGSGAVVNGIVVASTVVMSSEVSEVKKPDECAIFGDGQWSDGANKFMRSPFPGKLDAHFSGRYAGTQGYRHIGRTNVAFCDGSARSVRDCFKETHTAEKADIAEGTGFLSSDNSAYDLK